MIVQGVELFTCGHSCHNLQQRIRDLPDFRFYANQLLIQVKYDSRWPNKKFTSARNSFLVPNTIWALP